MDAIRVSKVENVICTRNGTSMPGTIHLTAHHLIFRYDASNEEELWVPYPLISLVTRLPQTMRGQCPLTLHCRTFETFSLSFEKDTDATDVFDSVKELTVATNVQQLYAFFYVPNPALPTHDGWAIYSPRDEFGRMGVGTRTKAWRFTDINKDYSFSSTYPSRLVVPSRISDTTLQYASKYRSKCRIPALTYLHWANFGSITRSSQPMVGITQNRSVQDEKLIESIFQTHHTPELRASGNAIYGATSTNLIIDARPTINAVGNTAKGAGTENMDHYKDSKKAYLGIDSIHVMRDSLNKVVEALREADVLLASINSDLPDQISGISVLDRQALRRSGWLRHIQIVLEGTNLITRNIHVNSSHVLIHCSDGWDRTSQLSALAQLCLDPFYRTIRGFEILIEKDWISFGHKFMDRCGHLSSDKFFISPNDNSGGNSEANAAQAFLASMQNRFASQGHLKETSPIFHQFLECVRQIQRQYPTRFEFNERFLRQLHYHLYSCQFGTFLFNCERERRVGEDGQAPAIERTISVWDFFNSPPEMEQNLNPTYSPQLDDPSNRSSGADMGVLFPNAKDVRFWNELYGRTDEEMNGRVHVAETTASPEDENVRTPSGTPSVPTIALPPSPPSSSHLSPTSPSPRPVSPSVTASPSIPSDARPAPSRVDSFRPISSSTSAFSLRGFPASSSAGSPGLPSSPSSPKTAGSRADILNSGVKSVWGRLSSNASAAFSVVQDAYDNVAKDLRSTASSETPHEELRGRDNLAAWGEEPSFGSSGFSSNPWSRSKPEPSVASSSSVFQNPWGSSSPSDEPKPYTPPPVSEHPTDSPSSGLAAMTLETVAAAPRQQQRQPDRLPDMPLPSASNVAQPAKVAAATSAIDPLGVGFS